MGKEWVQKQRRIENQAQKVSKARQESMDRERLVRRRTKAEEEEMEQEFLEPMIGQR